MEQKALLTIDLDLANLSQEVADGKKSTTALVSELKKLKDVGKENTAEYAKLEAQLKVNKDEVRGNALQLANLTKSQKLNNGSIVEMRANLSSMTKVYNSLSKEEREAADNGVKLQKAIRAQSDELKGLEGNVGNTTRNVGNYKEAILEALQAQLPFVGSLRQSAGQFNSLTTAGTGNISMLSKFKAALIGTGIGAIIVLLGLFINHLRKLETVMDFVDRATAGFAVVIERLGSTISGVTNIFTDFAGSMQKVGDFMRNPIKAMREYGNEMGKAVNRAMDLTAELDDLNDAMAIQEVRTAKTQNRIAQLMLQARNRSLSNAQKQAIIREAEDLDEALFQTRKKQADDLYRITIERIANLKKLTADETKVLLDGGSEAAFAFQSRNKIEAKHTEEIIKLSLEREEIVGESVKRGEKLANMADALAEKAAAEAEKREERRKALAAKAAADREKELEKLRKEAEIRRELGQQDQDILDGLSLSAQDRKLKQQQAQEINNLRETFQIKKRELISQNKDTAQLERDFREDLQELEYFYSIASARLNRSVELEQNRIKYRELIEERKKAGADTLAAIEAQRLAEIEINAKWDAIDQDGAARRKEQELNDYAEMIAFQQSLNEQVLASEERIGEARLGLAAKLTNGIAGYLKEGTIAAKAAFAAQKAIAIAEIVVNARRAMAANTTRGELLALQQAAIPFYGAFAASATKIRTQLENKLIQIDAALSAAFVAGQVIQGFNKGGLFKSDGKGALVKGAGTETSDSINARLSNNEVVINANSAKMFLPLLSYLNQMGGGRAFDKPNQSGSFATGGLFADTLGRNASNNVLQNSQNTNELALQIARSIQPVLIMEQLQYKQNDMQAIEVVQNI